jgi:hypothetical protein
MIYPDPKTRLGRMKIWTPLIKEVSVKTGECRERLIGLMWRESLCGFALSPPGDPCGLGDNGNGFGLFQIDKRYHASFVNSAVSQDPYQQAMFACDILRSARDWFRRSASSIKGYDLERATYAAYNAGAHSVYVAIMNGKDPDTNTTGHDYSKYIFTLAEVLQKPDYQGIWS